MCNVRIVILTGHEVSEDLNFRTTAHFFHPSSMTCVSRLGD